MDTAALTLAATQDNDSPVNVRGNFCVGLVLKTYKRVIFRRYIYDFVPVEAFCTPPCPALKVPVYFFAPKGKLYRTGKIKIVS